MGSFSMVHWLIFGVVAILLFGNRLPSVARSLGRSLLEFKKGMNHFETDLRSSIYPDSRRGEQSNRRLLKTTQKKWADNLSPLYWPAIRFGINVQATAGVLTALMPDTEHSFFVFTIALMSHWIGIFLLLAYRPNSPAKIDIVFVRWGTPLLMIAMMLIVPLILKTLGRTAQLP
jgi:TatA/E family protein of Tat protein translocase